MSYRWRALLLPAIILVGCVSGSGASLGRAGSVAAPPQPTIQPERGDIHTVFRVHFTSRARLGLRRGVLYDYLLLMGGHAAGSLASGCTGGVPGEVDHAGENGKA